jgi:hypothetical protein
MYELERECAKERKKECKIETDTKREGENERTERYVIKNVWIKESVTNRN